MEDKVNDEGMLQQDKLVIEVRDIIENGRRQAYDAVGYVSIITFWNVGRRIVEEEQS